MKILYLTYDGLSDPLGQSQVLPYISGLSDEGFDITVVSFEKKNIPAESIHSIKVALNEKKIKWMPLNYSKRPPVLSTLYDILKLKRRCIRLQKENNYHIVHCRSYITSYTGILLKKRFRLKYVFDMRGFYADERAEGGLWNQNKIIYRIIYNYFKKKEKIFFRSADSIVTLTEASRKIICNDFSVPGSKVRVIPCCVDEHLFDPAKIEIPFQQKLKQRYGIRDHDFVLSYLGAIGTWYLLGEMLDFFKQLTENYPDSKFLFITRHPPEDIIDLALKKNIVKENIIVVSAFRNEVPSFLALSRLSIFFIKPTYSKIASSPTKQAELLAMGIPLICNTGIGDVEEIIRMSGAGISINKFTKAEFARTINQIPFLLRKDKNEIRNHAIKMFSLSKGVNAYKQIYNDFIKPEEA